MTQQPLSVGDTAPGFTLRDQNGRDVSLSEYQRERAVLLVFYPFAFSGICTGELGEIRDDLGRFESEAVTTVAISCDPMFSLRAWADQQGYFFPLLSDFWPRRSHRVVARQPRGSGARLHRLPRRARPTRPHLRTRRGR